MKKEQVKKCTLCDTEITEENQSEKEDRCSEYYEEYGELSNQVAWRIIKGKI